MKAQFCVLAISALATLCGCAEVVQHHPPRSHSPIAVKITNGFAAVQAGAAAITIAATIQNDSKNKGLSWHLTAGGSDCSPACGILTPSPSPSLTASYAAPASVPPGAAASPTITATSVADSSKSDQFSFTINSTGSITVTITGAFQNVTSAGAAINLSAQTNDPQGVTWALTSNGASCSPVCGTLQFSSGQHLLAIYTPPAIWGSGNNVSILTSATSLTDTTKFASFAFNIIAGPTSSYVFLLRGFDSNSKPMAIAGVIVVDVLGNIKDGELDLNQNGVITRAQSLQGNYTADTSFEDIIRGAITITSFTFPGTSINPVFQFVLRGSELEARAIEFDATGNLTAGSLVLQSGVAGATPSGIYAFGVDSDAPFGGRTVTAGAFDVVAGGEVNGVADESQAASPAVQLAQTLTGTAGAADVFGRGTISFTILGTTTNYVYYSANPGQMNLLQTGGGYSFGTLLSGTARGQGVDFDPNSGLFATSVIQMTGSEILPDKSYTSPDVAIGALTINHDNTLSLTYDSNDAGTVSTTQKITGTVTAYDPNLRRAVLSFPGGLQAGFMDTAAYYLYDDGSGYMIQIDSSASPAPLSRGFSGAVQRQNPGPYSNADINGALILISGGSSVPFIPNVVGASNATPANATILTIAYATSLYGGPQPNVSFNATYNVTDPVLGYGAAVFPAALYGDQTPQATAPASFYFITPNHIVTIGTKAGLPSGISTITPD